MFALLPSLVSPEQLGPAIGVNSITYNIARILGPLVSVAAITAVGFGFAFGLNSLTFLALIVALMLIRPRQVPADEAAAAAAAEPVEQQGAIREGISYVRHARRIRLMLLGVLVGAAAFDPVFTLAPVFASHVYGRSAASGGLLMASFGAGAIVAGLSSSRFLKGTTGLRYLTPFMLLFALGLVLFVLSPVFWMASASLFVAGIGSLFAMIAWTTGIQSEVPERLRGRVMAMWTLAFLGTRTFAGPLCGAIAASFSPQAAVIALTIPLVAMALFGAPRLRRMPVPDAQDVAPRV
jgi:MFS family permease